MNGCGVGGMVRRERMAQPVADLVRAEVDASAAVGEVLGLDEGVHVAPTLSRW
jgi:hypothetical protein